MKILFAACLTLLCLTACEKPSVAARASGSMAASVDDALLYAADTDNGVLGVVDVKTQAVIATVKVGDAPWRVVVAPDDTVFVANRGSRSISVIRRGAWAVAAELATDVDPVGLAMAKDGTLYVVCATASDASEYGTLTAFDTASLTKKWSLNVGAEPRGIALVANDRAIVSLFHEGEVAEVDLLKHALVKGQGSSLYQSSNRSAVTAKTPTAGGPVAFHPRAIGEVIATPDGTRAFVLGSLSRETPIVIPPSTFTPYYKAQGPGLAGSVTTTAVFTYDTHTGAVPVVDDVSRLSSGYGYGYGSSADAKKDFPQTSFAATASSRAILQGPTVGVTDYSGEWLYVVNRETRVLSLISATAREAKPEESTGYSYSYSYEDLPSLHSTAAIGSGSDGMVVMGDNQTAYVYSQFEHAVYRVGYDLKSHRLEGQGAIAKVGSDTLSPQLVEGRKLFFDATDRRVSAVEASVACSSCHIEGRDDGHTWNFPDGPRQTPTLAGRGILQTAPYHWSGEFPELKDFLSHTITARMGGTGIDERSAASLNAYMGALPSPENPYFNGTPTAEQVRGQQVFAKAQCGTCHAGQWLTNNANMNVATLSAKDNGLVVKGGLNVPSLKGLARSGPYLHDGSVVTLSERVVKNPDDRHGMTSTLTPAEVSDLVAYLRTL